MTNRDVMVQILHEVTGKPKKQVEKIVKALRFSLPDKCHKYDQRLTPDESEKLLTELRTEKEGILAWLVNGAMKDRLDLPGREQSIKTRRATGRA